METQEKAEKAAEIAAEKASPPAKPKGSPSLAPLTALRRRQRADFQKSLYQGLPESLLEDAEDGEADIDLSAPGMLGFAMDYMANLEDAYALVAIDKDAYEKWVKSCSDEDLSALHEWYQAKYPMGEA